MSNYEIKDKEISSNSEATSAVSTISYEVENAMVHGVSKNKIKGQLDTLQEKGTFPSNLTYLDSFYDPKNSSSYMSNFQSSAKGAWVTKAMETLETASTKLTAITTK